MIPLANRLEVRVGGEAGRLHYSEAIHWGRMM